MSGISLQRMDFICLMIPTMKLLQNPRFVVLGESPKDLYEYLQSDEMLFVRNRTIVSPTLGDQTGSKQLQKGKLSLTLYLLDFPKNQGLG